MDDNYLFNTIIADTYLKGASAVQIKLMPSPESSRVLLRIDGVWRQYMLIPAAAAYEVLKIIKSKADMDTDNSHLPNIGRFKFKHKGLPEFYLAVTTYPSDNQEEGATLKIQST